MSDLTASGIADAPATGGGAELSDIWRLLKPRVMQLVVFTCLAAMLAAPAGEHPLVALASLICIAAGAGAAGALNMWYDADLDAEMSRTADRPVPRGLIEPSEALGLGLGLSIISVMLLGVFANFLAAALLAFTIFFYAVVYTMWLKRATPQNIVIGGLAGAVPPLIAWVAVTGEVALAPLLMVAVIFLWTPPHFWALALFRHDDYEAVSVPMLPVVAGDAETRRQIWLYALMLAPVAIASAFTIAGGPIYLAISLAMTAKLLLRANAVRRRTKDDSVADGYRAEKRLFGVSIVYLFAIFGAFIADAVLRAVAGPFWPVWF